MAPLADARGSERHQLPTEHRRGFEAAGPNRDSGASTPAGVGDVSRARIRGWRRRARFERPIRAGSSFPASRFFVTAFPSKRTPTPITQSYGCIQIGIGQPRPAMIVLAQAQIACGWPGLAAA